MFDSPDYAALRFWLALLQWLSTGALAVFVWIDRGRNANAEAITKLTDEQQHLESRLLTVEQALKHVPTHDDITRLSNQSAALSAKLDRVTNTLDRIHDYLMNRK